MKKAQILCGVTCIVGIMMISIGMVLQNENGLDTLNANTTVQEFDIRNMAASANMIVEETEKSKHEVTENVFLTEVSMETAPASVIIPPRVEVYEGMTLEELAIKLDRNLGSDIVAGKGFLIATECINKGVDPYVALAILLHETGCKSRCSQLARSCNNFGGQKGSPGCNGGSYKAFNSIDEGLVGFIDNLYRNYYSKGLNTIEKIGPRYAESPAWRGKIAWYVEQIRAN